MVYMEYAIIMIVFFFQKTYLICTIGKWYSNYVCSIYYIG